MEKITQWLQKDLPQLLEKLLDTLFTTSALVQLAILGAVLFLMFPLGGFFVSLFRKTCHRLELGQRIAMFLNRIRTFFVRPPLSEEGAIKVFSCLQSLEALGRPLAAYLLLKIGVSSVAGVKSVHADILLRVMPLFLVWAVFRWLSAFLPIFLSEETFAPLQRRLLRPVFWIACLLQLFQQLEATLLLVQRPFLKLAGASLTLKNVFLAFLVLYIFLKLSSHTRHFLQEGLFPRMKVTPALNNTLATFVSYVLIGLGFFMAISTLGFSASSLTVLFGALTVGIGFGLQSIINNFVSGLILLAEQSIAPGDVIHIDGKICIVEQIRIRSTTVRTYDNVELRVPNSKLLGDIVQSFTGGDAKTRTSIRVGVSYDDDPRTVEACLLQAAAEVEEVLDKPAPAVVFVDYGDNAIIFDLMVWVDHPKRIPPAQSKLRFQVWYILQGAGVAFPFPQRDLNLGQGWERIFGDKAAAPSAPASPPAGANRVAPIPASQIAGQRPAAPTPKASQEDSSGQSSATSALKEVLGEAPSAEAMPAPNAPKAGALKEVLGEASSDQLPQPAPQAKPRARRETRSMAPFRPDPEKQPAPRPTGGFFAPPLPDDEK